MEVKETTKEQEAIKQVFTIDVPIYQCKVHVYLCVNIIEACIELQLNQRAIEAFREIDLSGLTIADANDSANVVLLLEDNVNSKTIVHETNHAVVFILEARNTPLVRETMEAYAYLQEYLYDAIMTKFKAFIKN